MKRRRTRKLTACIRKVGCALLSSCILLSSCGQSAQDAQIPPQDLTQDAQKPTNAPEEIQSPVLTAKPEPTPEPTPTPTSTPEATPMPDFTFLPQLHPFSPGKTSLLDYMAQEEINTAFSLSYDPCYEQMQLYGRYQGHLKVFRDIYYYCIDLIRMDNSAPGDFLINIKIYDNSTRYLKYGESSLLQNMYYYIDFAPMLDTATEVLQIVDINGDECDDFIFDLGMVGNKNKYSLAFVCDVESNSYVFLGEFYTATYMPEYQTICEENNSSMGCPFQKYKYFVTGTQAILTEAMDYIPGECETYTYQKLIDGELVTILESGTYEELCEFISDFEIWRNTPTSLE